MPSSPLSPLPPKPKLVPKTSSSQTRIPSPTKLRSPNAAPREIRPSKTARLPREFSISPVQSASPRNTTTNPRDKTSPPNQEKVLPKPDQEPKLRTTPPPSEREISHAPPHAVDAVDVDVDARNPTAAEHEFP